MRQKAGEVMTSFQGIPIDDGVLINNIIIHSVFTLIFIAAPVWFTLNTLKVYKRYKKLSDNLEEIEEADAKRPKRARKKHTRKHRDKKSLRNEIVRRVAALMLFAFLLFLNICTVYDYSADYIKKDYEIKTGSYEIDRRRTGKRGHETYVIFEDGSRLLYSSAVDGEDGDTGYGMFVYGKRSGRVVGFVEENG